MTPTELASPFGAVTATRDANGYPRLTSPTVLGGDWALGWFHAQDRLVQIQVMLVFANGRALEILGDTPLAREGDRAAHLHDFGRDAQAQVERLSAPHRRRLDAYCAGFNAGVEARGWPLVLRALGLKPADYTPADMMRVVRLVGWFGLGSLHEWAERVFAELTTAGVSAETLALLVGDAVTPAELARAPRFVWPSEHALHAPSAIGGSNAIVVGKQASKSGAAMLLADPHMEIGRIPPVLYAMHLELPHGQYLQGLTVPGCAWPSFGRTARAAWGYTYGHGDGVDLCALTLEQGKFKDGDALRPFTRREATVKVRGKSPETWAFFDCEHGTVLGDPHSAPVLPCLKWAGLRETSGDFEAGLSFIDARSVDDLVAANRKLKTLSLNALVADADGNIAQLLCGRVDAVPDSGGVVIRHAPPASTELPQEQRPFRKNPANGVLVSANDGWNPRWIPLPEPRWRAVRLTELMQPGPFSGDDLKRAVCDAVDAGARRLLGAWEPHLPDAPRARALCAWAKSQPGVGQAHFESLALYEALHHEVFRALFERRMGAALASRLLDELAGVTLFQDSLDLALAFERPGISKTELEELLAVAWPRALERVKTHGLPHREPFKNFVFQGKLPRALGFDTAPIEVRGGETTPLQARTLTLLGQPMVFGPAGRYFCDLGQPGGAYSIPGGASERRFGPGYGAAISAWADGLYTPLG